MQKENGRCFLCGKTTGLEIHHVMNGPYRKKSEKDGFVVQLCMMCHYNVHNIDNILLQKLKKQAMNIYLQENTDTLYDWIARYGKTY